MVKITNVNSNHLFKTVSTMSYKSNLHNLLSFVLLIVIPLEYKYLNDHIFKYYRRKTKKKMTLMQRRRRRRRRRREEEEEEEGGGGGEGVHKEEEEENTHMKK